jgi:hypothetical protein
MYELAILRDSFNCNLESEVEMQGQEVEFRDVSHKGFDRATHTGTRESLLEPGYTITG